MFLFPALYTSCGDPASKEKADSKPKVITRITSLPQKVIAPKDNPSTPEKELLGKLLFFDPILSGDKDIACATCHHPSNGYAEFLDISMGTNAKGLGSKRKFNRGNDIPFVKRNAQTVLNTAFNGIDANRRYDPELAPMFWDERTKSLELQAFEPIKALEEMRGRNFEEDEILNIVVERLKQIPEYKRLFEAAFEEEDAVTVENLGKAIASFERTLVTTNSRFDQYMRGNKDALLTSEKEGLALFKKVGCINCHNGPMFSDYKIHVLGVQENSKLNSPDLGTKDSFGFRTPSLRNLRFTAPYMHNGSLKTLRRVLEFYEDISDGKSRNPNVSPDKFDPFIKELQLSVQDMSLIISFLNTLNEEDFDKDIPKAVPSGLEVGGAIQ
ncbi:MAG: cytochrome-c peroxidase [Flavobacteriaceae bacterium]